MGKLNIIGLGYIGLPTALMFAANGVEVVGTDLNTRLVETLNEGKLTFEEAGLEEVFDNALSKGIEFKTEYEKTNRYIITVPTPYMSVSKKIDAKYVIAATKQVLEVCEQNTILVIESTISPGTIDKFVRPIIEEKGFKIGEDIHLVHAPERIIPGKMVYELEHNSRTIGADSREVGEEVKSWYESFCKNEIVVTDIKTAEMSKVVENTFRDINIAFANELAKMCDREGMDVYELIRIANKHPRVNILTPGPGVGGHCISVDPWFLVGDYPDIVNVVLGAREVNDAMPQYVFDKIHKIMKENNIKNYSKVGLYGLTYKENVDDMRESPTLQLLDIFEKYNIDSVKIYDPFIKEKKFENQVMDMYSFLKETELVVVLVNHDEIKNNQELLSEKVVYDTKNIIENGKKIYKI
ncbi:nucleotide sugar dehydrogenase [Paeniclostridium sordellii]|uniref:nucleotide sugar dehydrogenase n=1 Tax=Paraclostridium sordellii TaxID=1505 RepID=UPI0012EE540B|nr:nucleotide sugar dehydrogenase [Paeniclostridium sordellii]MDU2687202.1 nucleotide sugar dehydrogenase [Paeniclostridium sordellii]MDU6247859.1 nucleotide sugar dehydrogenase [Paeniclostridium sordellii]MDU6483418.1 nucleotide sugar dehydrogenase [Paeniclostridium sordellii]MVO72192.1 nucleotide sugar dehydrogenase [Paeniclostridium sordellii]